MWPSTSSFSSSWLKNDNRGTSELTAFIDFKVRWLSVLRKFSSAPLSTLVIIVCNNNTSNLAKNRGRPFIIKNEMNRAKNS